VQGSFGSLDVASAGGTLTAEGALTLERTADGAAYEPNRRVTSDEISSEGQFNAVGVRWRIDLPAGTNAALQIRLGDGEVWTDWRTLTPSEDATFADDPSTQVSDLIFVPRGDRVQLAVDMGTTDAAVTPTVSYVQADFVDSAAGPTASAAASAATISAQSATTSSPPVLSRAQWGADESWMTWPPEVVPAQKVVVHHTAGSDGGNDPAAVVRGIYYYHAVTLGWGDIGYNYLIDPAGRVYEGRRGGLGVVAGHTSGYNTGTVGVALIGTYESTAATPAAEQALADLTGYLSAHFDLDPTAAVPFQGLSTPTLAGHRDYGSTLCPGTTFYSHLPAIRASAANAKGSYSAGQFAGALVGVAGHVLEANQSGSATITFRNTGSAPWVNSGDHPVVLATFGPEGHASPLTTGGWTSASEAGAMQEASVGQGGSATFKVPLTGAGLGDTADSFALYRRGAGVIAGTGLTLVRSVRPGLRGSIDPLPDPISIEGGTRSVVEVTVRNTGAKTWPSTGANLGAINLTQPKGRTSAFQDPSWPLTYRPLTMPVDVPPDGVLTLRVPLKVPAKAGDYREPMQVVVDKVGFVPETEFTLHLAVSNPFQSELRERPIVVFAAPGQTVNVDVAVANRSGVTWQPSGSGVVALQSVSASGASTFKTASWPTPTQPLTIPYAVEPKQTAALTFPVAAPTALGSYSESFRLVSDGATPIDGSTFTLNVQVRAPYAAKVLDVQSPAAGASRATVRIQNVGSSTWQSSGAGGVSVTTDNPRKHPSVLAAASWQDSGTPTLLEPPKVAPDQATTLSIELTPPAGSGSEQFTLLDPSGKEIPGSQFTLTASGGGPGAPSGPLGANLRVGITATSNGFPVSASGAFTVKDSAGAVLGSAGSGQVNLSHSGSTYSVSGAVNGSSSNPLRVEAADNGVLTLPAFENRPSWNTSLNDNTFRGTIEARRGSDGKVWAVNELPMELYLRGIAEASNGDNATYLQVMAIAERTYAEYVRSIGGKHPSNGFDVDAVNDQVYRGYGFELRSPDIAAAVDATKGMLVTHGGQVVVTPYFSQSDGRTRSWTEVWGGSTKPWLVSVPVSESSGKALLGHGVGMDASAARARALAGKGRDDILDDFYTGAAIEKKY